MQFNPKQGLLSREQLIERVPAFLTKEPIPGRFMEAYNFLSTEEVVDSFEKQGWGVSNAGSVGGKSNFLKPWSKHIIRFRNTSDNAPIVGDSFVEIVFTNSHDGSSVATIDLGLFRLICSNGMVVSDAKSKMRTAISHRSKSIGDLIAEEIEAASLEAPILASRVSNMRSTELSRDRSLEFAERAAGIRWPGEKPESLDLVGVLCPLRNADEGQNLWNVFNSVQEKLDQGGRGFTKRKQSKLGLDSSTRFNKEIWELAESYVSV